MAAHVFLWIRYGKKVATFLKVFLCTKENQPAQIAAVFCNNLQMNLGTNFSASPKLWHWKMIPWPFANEWKMISRHTQRKTQNNLCYLSHLLHCKRDRSCPVGAVWDNDVTKPAATVLISLAAVIPGDSKAGGDDYNHRCDAAPLVPLVYFGGHRLAWDDTEAKQRPPEATTRSLCTIQTSTSSKTSPTPQINSTNPVHNQSMNKIR